MTRIVCVVGEFVLFGESCQKFNRLWQSVFQLLSERRGDLFPGGAADRDLVRDSRAFGCSLEVMREHDVRPRNFGQVREHDFVLNLEQHEWQWAWVALNCHRAFASRFEN